jgi:ketosteroid isomerase-like protein
VQRAQAQKIHPAPNLGNTPDAKISHLAAANFPNVAHATFESGRMKEEALSPAFKAYLAFILPPSSFDCGTCHICMLEVQTTSASECFSEIRTIGMDTLWRSILKVVHPQHQRSRDHIPTNSDRCRQDSVNYQQMKSFLTILIIGLGSVSAWTQAEFQAMVDADRSLSSYAVEKGTKAAYLRYLGDDGVIFKPEATNGKDWWNLQKEEPPTVLKRTMEHADIASNGLLGYTTGVWEETPKKQGGPARQIGQYITVWSKKPDGKFYAIIDVMTKYDEAAPPVGNPMLVTTYPKDINKRRWSAADPSMKFLRMGMDRGGLGNAFDEWASEDIRLIIEENPPIYGKKNAVKAMSFGGVSETGRSAGIR